MGTMAYVNLPNLPRTVFIATYSDRPDCYLVWFPPLGVRRDWNVYRCDRTAAGERITRLAERMGWHAFCVQAETMFCVRGGADRALKALASA